MTEEQVREEARIAANTELEQLRVGYSVDYRLNWLEQSFRLSRQHLAVRENHADILRAFILALPEIQARKLTVDEARMLRVCRICRKADVGALTLMYGEEYAHTNCLICPHCGRKAESA